MQVRYDRQIDEETAVKFMTDGILLRELQSDLLLRSYSVLVLDEAHERSLNTDLLLGEPGDMAVDRSASRLLGSRLSCLHWHQQYSCVRLMIRSVM